MTEEALFPGYIQRLEEDQIRQLAARVCADGTSRVVLLYGPGGVGKTWMVRQLALENASHSDMAWVDPIDIDDSEFWLLSNLEKYIASQLDPDNENGYFAPYLEHLARLPRYTRPRVGHETVVSYLDQIKTEFLECYKNFIQDSHKSVVIIFDTVEVIRGMGLLRTLAQLMRALPRTLFILSGRPQQERDQRPDFIKRELEHPHAPLPVTPIWLDDFTREAALEYLNSSGVATGLSEDEKLKLAHLTHGHPLWLAFTVDYLEAKGLPEEAEQTSLDNIERHLPYQGQATKRGQDLREAFDRHLVASYRETDFWHEAIKRLAVARQSVSPSIWRRFMDDRPLPEGIATLDDAWPVLLRTPWIRPRANGQYVTLHDVVAEELARRIIPLHDQGRQWRVDLWHRAAEIYAERIASRETELRETMASVEERARIWDAIPPGNGDLPPTEEERQFIEDVAKLDVEMRELSQFKAVQLYYEILCNFARGCRLFIDLFAKAKKEHDILFQELLALEMERFLPGRASYAIDDVVGEVIGWFQAWLEANGRDFFMEIGLSMVDYLIRSEQPLAAIELLDELPESADYRVRFRLNNLRGNACMRIPGKVTEGQQFFELALTDAMALDAPDRHKLIAKAHKELGFYYRNLGKWDDADEAYRNARDAISGTLSVDSPAEDREEMASIQTNWAYVKGLVGSYREGINLVESAIKVRRRLGLRQEEGTSLSVRGEVYRYERRFHPAWAAYAQAQEIFDDLRNSSWLGLIYQEQAICLFQATQDEITVTSDDQMKEAKRLAERALELCRNQAVRGYPSALNRAGRIFGQDDPEAGLGYLATGIDVARQLSDGWFLFANLVEYVELCYRVWYENRERSYLDQIASRKTEIDQVMTVYEFPDLKGRWKLLQGHLAVHDWLEATLATKDPSLLNSAWRFYADGFALIAQQHVGSSGASAIASEFEKLGTLVWLLPEEIRAKWQHDFRQAWGESAPASTLLLARLEELY